MGLGKQERQHIRDECDRWNSWSRAKQTGVKEKPNEPESVSAKLRRFRGKEWQDRFASKDSCISSAAAVLQARSIDDTNEARLEARRIRAAQARLRLVSEPSTSSMPTSVLSLADLAAKEVQATPQPTLRRPRCIYYSVYRQGRQGSTVGCDDFR
jgi:hypothetical protein